MIGTLCTTCDTLQWWLRWTNELLVVSEFGVKYDLHRLAETLSKFKRYCLVLAISCRQVMYVTVQSSHLSTGISYSWVECLYSVQSKELEMTEMPIRHFE